MDAEEKQKRLSAFFQSIRETEAEYHSCSQSLPCGFKPTQIERAYAKRKNFIRPPRFYCERKKDFDEYTYTVALENDDWRPHEGHVHFSRNSYRNIQEIKGCGLEWFVEHVGVDNAKVLEFFETALAEIRQEVATRLRAQIGGLKEPAITLSVRLFEVLSKKAQLEEKLATLQGATRIAISQLAETKSAFRSKAVRQAREDLETALRNLEEKQPIG